MAGPSFKPTPELTALWYRALESEFGIELTPSDPIIMQDLYASRATTGDPRLEAVMLTQMKDGTIWLVKKEISMEEVDGPSLP